MDWMGGGGEKERGRVCIQVQAEGSRMAPESSGQLAEEASQA